MNPNVVDDRDVWRAALILLDKFQQNAAGKAAEQALERKSRGDTHGEEHWGRVMAAIMELRRPTRYLSERAH